MPTIEPDLHRSMSSKLTHVVVGVIENDHGEVLIAKRPAHVHQGGLWEFPGGKLERGETPFSALQRELQEEVAIQLEAVTPLIQIPYHYPEKSVLLDVMRVSDFHGDAAGLEGQTIRWVSKARLIDYTFPSANRSIMQALQLPDCYLITGDFQDKNAFLAKLGKALERGIQLVQLRAKQLNEHEFAELVYAAKRLCQAYQARLLINSTPERAIEYKVDGIHLTSKRLMRCSGRPLAEDKLVAASVHNRKELAQAMRVGVDFIVIAPVLPTMSHPAAASLGWDGLQQLIEQADVPVYALGGVTKGHLSQARECGAQGIAAIRSLWEDT